MPVMPNREIFIGETECWRDVAGREDEFARNAAASIE
jgi:hypothetical protein